MLVYQRVNQIQILSKLSLCPNPNSLSLCLPIWIWLSESLSKVKTMSLVHLKTDERLSWDTLSWFYINWWLTKIVTSEQDMNLSISCPSISFLWFQQNDFLFHCMVTPKKMPKSISRLYRFVCFPNNFHVSRIFQNLIFSAIIPNRSHIII